MDPETIPKLQWDILPKIVNSDDPRKNTIYLPGYGYADLDKEGNVSPWRAARSAEGGRALFSMHTENSPINLMTEGLLVLASAEYHFTNDFYDENSRNKPLRDDITLGQVTKYSYSHHDKIHVAATGKLLFDAKVTLVLIDFASRKPKVMPDWFKERYSSSPQLVDVTAMERLVRPVSTHFVPYTVVWSDCDRLQHSNQSSYIKYCLDAAETLSINNPSPFSVMKGEVTKYHIKSITCRFLRETRAGDKFLIHVWEDAKNPWKLCFDIVRNGVSTYNSCIEFGENEDHFDSKL